MTGTTSTYGTESAMKVLPYGMVRCEDGLVRDFDGWGRVVPEWQVDLSVPVPAPSRATRVVSWIGWHLGELAGVTVPAAVAVAVTPWAWLVSGVVAAGWAMNEIRTAAEQGPLRAELAVRHAPTDDVPDDVTGGSDVDSADGTLDGPAPDADSGVEGVA